MKIKKINSIKNIGSFNDFQWDQNIIEFHDKRNIFYGMNGSGKTTLSELIRSISEGRTTQDILSKNNDGTFSISTDGSVLSNFNTANTNIKVFNKHFIEENVFCQNGPVPILHLGKENDELQKQHDALVMKNKELGNELSKYEQDKKVSEKQRDNLCIERAKLIKEIIGGSYHKGNLEQKISGGSFSKRFKTEDELEKLKSVVKDVQKEIILQIQFDDKKTWLFYSDCLDIAQKNVISNAISGINSDIEMWLKKGLEIHQEKTSCEFCGGNIQNDIKEKLEAHFNDEYNDTILCINEIIENAPEIEIRFFDGSNLYDDLSKDYLDFKKKFEQEVEVYKTWKKELLSKMQQKKVRLNESYKLETLPFDIKNIELYLGKINEIIEKHNERTRNFEQKILSAKEDLETHYISEILDDYDMYNSGILTMDTRITGIKKTISENKSQIKDISLQIRPEAKALSSINTLIHRILGRDDISLSIKDDGYQIVREGNNPFHPSEGERTVIGLAYFINKLEDQNTEKTDIIFFDDPITSLDEGILFNIYGLIACLNLYQIFILTHHYQFLRYFIDQLKEPIKGNANYYRINCFKVDGIRKSSINELEPQIYRYHSEYEFLFKTLYDFVESHRLDQSGKFDIEDGYNYANMTRKVIEIFGSIYYPKDDLGSKLKSCLNKAGMENDYNEIYRFINSFSHNNSLQNLSTFDTTIYTNNLWNIVDKTLSMIQKINSDHYGQMTNV